MTLKAKSRQRWHDVKGSTTCKRMRKRSREGSRSLNISVNEILMCDIRKQVKPFRRQLQLWWRGLVFLKATKVFKIKDNNIGFQPK